jgi:HTH-type transcriptional regulator/antitoxin HigA
MDIRPIRTEDDYKEALAEIEQLFDASPGTLEGDRLEVLVTLVEAYEDQHYSIPAPDPIEALYYYVNTLSPEGDSFSGHAWRSRLR